MKNDRYVIYKGYTDVEILDTNPEYTNENLVICEFDFEDNEEVAEWFIYEIEPLIKLLNEQNNELEKKGIKI